jgi:hypothetical protein
MKKTLTILSAVFITFISFTAKAQDTKEPKDPGEPVDYVKSYLDLFGGLSYPVGNFQQTVYSNNRAGFGRKGVTFGFEGVWYAYKNLGVALTFAFQDQGELDSLDVQKLADGYNTSYNKESTTVTTVGRYHSVELMIGPQYSFKYNKFILDLRAQAGILKSISSPSYTTYFDNYSTTFNQLSSGSKVFAYSGGIGLRYTFADGFDVGIKGTYLGTNDLGVINQSAPGTVGRIVTGIPITVFQTTIGITVHL